MPKDKVTVLRIDKLHPKAKGIFSQFIDECEKAFNTTFRVSQGLRTIAEQDALYAQGRTKPGPVVTNAKGGTSYHNYGLAVDLVAMFPDGSIDWKYDMSKLKPIAVKLGLFWGGDFKTIVDKPHFEISFGKKPSELLAMRNAGKLDANGYVLI